MKNKRDFVIAVIVLVFVSSAFKFNTKKIGIFCATTTAPNVNCDIYQNYGIDIGPATHWYQREWDGDPAHCRGSNNCPTPVRLEPD